MNLRVLGLDPGLGLTGYAVVDGNSARRFVVEAGVLRPKTKSLESRLKELHDGLSEIIAEHQPAEIAVEALYSHYERPRTAILMGHARGVLMLAAADAGIAVASYLPTRVKKTATGSGRASKAQMQRAVQVEFGLPAPPDPPDVADALAVALCHFHRMRLAG